ncbi:MAG TPA: hypothetical protein DD638_02575 [Pasteurellaceae bacterium]|nr:hypothetical protein [Pasteurellaceae bacterium]
MLGKTTALRFLFAAFLLLILLLFIISVKQRDWLQTDLKALLPQENRFSEIQVLADKAQEEQLNQQIIALVGNRDKATAFNSAQRLAEQWQQSALFRQVHGQLLPDIQQLQNEIKQLRLGVLPQNIRHQLLTSPADYFQQYAQQLTNPFNQINLLPLDQDWLGFGRFVLPQSSLLPAIKWDPDSGMLFLQRDGITWVLLRARLAQGSLMNIEQHLLDELQQSKHVVLQDRSMLLTAGTALFAATAKQQAEKESVLMSVLGVGLTLLLLLSIFRSLRTLWLFLPIVIGMVSGVAVTVICFGHIHILTLVIGTSLIGVLVDFPLHWLAASLFSEKWRPEKSMTTLRLTFLISLSITLLGYGLLWFTVLPVLKQTALFSAAALIGAVLCTLLFLPYCFRNYRPRKRFNTNKSWHIRLPKIVQISFAVFVIAGIYKSQWQDDIRQWVAMPAEILDEARQIAELTGLDLGSQYFLLEAENDDALLSKDKDLTIKLTHLQQQGKLKQFQSLSQWISSEADQKAFIQQLTETIQLDDYAVLQELGIPPEQLQNTFIELNRQPPLTFEAALQTQLGQGWKTLYLGKLMPDKVAGLIKVSGITDMDAVQKLASQSGIYWQDKRSRLNQSFQQTRNQAAWLKLLSFALAGLLLWRFFGMKKTGQILLIPLFAIVSTVAIFGWLGISISLFTMFGLLLVSAIAIDYTAYMQTVQEPLYSRQVAVTLASLTTLISFVLLSFSSTPAVSSFGLSVSIGVGLSLLATLKTSR